MSFDAVLIANRGEIACRVIRSAREAGLRTIAVYSDADAAAPHVALADDAVRIGPAPAAESYLNAEAILAAAEETGAGAIHPGYGFLSENAEFAEAVANAGLTFIGPAPDAIRVMGDKASAKRAMIAAGVPCVPGYQGDDQSDARLAEAATEAGFPVMVKASAGGGGRGMRLVHDPADLSDALRIARAEALSAFGSDHLIIEKAVIRPRHVEVQVFADAHGTCVHLGERDCSVQRRHQKVLEEAPCPVMTPDLRAAMGEAAVAAARAVDYVGAGTVEFLLDGAGAFYFLEMNTRLQVEHPVTEMVTGLDLVALQFAVAQGRPLGFGQDVVALTGHAIEARLYAEDPGAGFLPSIGPIDLWRPASAPHLRIDAGIAEGGEVSSHYDAMVAKVIAWGATRDEARRRLIRGLETTALVGPATNAGFLIDALAHPVFAAGEATTSFIEDAWPDGVAAEEPDAAAFALAAALSLQAERDASRAAAGLVGDNQLGWRSDAAAEARLTLTAGDARRELWANPTPTGWRIAAPGGTDAVEVALTGGGAATVAGRRVAFAAKIGAGHAVSLAAGRTRAAFHREIPGAEAGAAGGEGALISPMPGQVVEVLAAPGDRVSAGQTVVVVEAMKMRHRVAAPRDGALGAVAAAVGDQVAKGAVLAELEAEA